MDLFGVIITPTVEFFISVLKCKSHYGPGPGSNPFFFDFMKKNYNTKNNTSEYSITLMLFFEKKKYFPKQITALPKDSIMKTHHLKKKWKIYLCYKNTTIFIMLLS